MQKVLTCYSQTPDLRTALDGWSAEDSTLCRNVQQYEESPDSSKWLHKVDKYKGFYCYRTPLEALASGWELLAPPQPIVDEYFKYMWWFTR